MRSKLVPVVFLTWFVPGLWALYQWCVPLSEHRVLAFTWALQFDGTPTAFEAELFCYQRRISYGPWGPGANVPAVLPTMVTTAAPGGGILAAHLPASLCNAEDESALVQPIVQWLNTPSAPQRGVAYVSPAFYQEGVGMLNAGLPTMVTVDSYVSRGERDRRFAAYSEGHRALRQRKLPSLRNWQSGNFLLPYVSDEAIKLIEAWLSQQDRFGSRRYIILPQCTDMVRAVGKMLRIGGYASVRRLLEKGWIGGLGDAPKSPYRPNAMADFTAIQPLARSVNGWQFARDGKGTVHLDLSSLRSTGGLSRDRVSLSFPNDETLSVWGGDWIYDRRERVVYRLTLYKNAAPQCATSDGAARD